MGDERTPLEVLQQLLEMVAAGVIELNAVEIEDDCEDDPFGTSTGYVDAPMINWTFTGNVPLGLRLRQPIGKESRCEAGQGGGG